MRIGTPILLAQETSISLRVMATNPIAPPLCLTFARCLKTQLLSSPGITYAGHDEEDRWAPGTKSRRTRRQVPHVTGSRLPHSRWY